MKIVTILFSLYFTLVILLYFIQERLIFFPDDRICNDLKTIEFEGENIRFIEKPNSQAKGTLIHFHGNAGGVCDRTFVIDQLSTLPLNIVLVEYPGYSGNKPFPTLKRIKENSLKILKYFKNKGGPIFLYGESLGSSVATYVASLEKIDGLILQSPFPSLGEIGQSAYPIFPVKWLIKDDFSFNKISTKSLILIAQEDEIIPKKLSEEQSKFFENVKVFTFPNRTHNDLVLGNQKLWSEVINFLLPQ
ncbi:MAG: alpha/beta hydrolase [Bacteriovoracales bacterium]